MPKICALRIIDGELWARIGKPGEFQSGIALWTPQEQEAQRLAELEKAVSAVEALRETL